MTTSTTTAERFTVAIYEASGSRGLFHRSRQFASREAAEAHAAKLLRGILNLGWNQNVAVELVTKGGRR